MKPGFEHGNGIGRFDSEIIQILPPSVKIVAGAGAGYDWIDTGLLGEKGWMIYHFG